MLFEVANIKDVSAKAKKACFLLVASSSSPETGGSVKLQESSDFFDQLNSAESFKRKPRVAHQPKPSMPGRVNSDSPMT